MRKLLGSATVFNKDVVAEVRMMAPPGHRWTLLDSRLPAQSVS